MSKKLLKIQFIDFIDNLSVNTFPLTKELLKYYNVIEDNTAPDIAICSMWGTEHLNITIPKIYFCYETYFDNRNMYDLSVSSYPARNDMEIQWNSMIHYNYIDSVLNNDYGILEKFRKHKKTKFCAFMYANKYARERVWFCRKLQKYKWVDCLGKVLNNIKLDDSKSRFVNDWSNQQLDIYKNYKFVIGFENKSIEGYVCEKILQPLLVGSIPIYWGGKDVGQYFNPECFINVNDFDNFDDCIEYVKKVDNDSILYKKYRDAIPILPTSKLHTMTDEKISAWILPKIEQIMHSDYTPIGKIIGYKKYKCLFNNWYWRKKQRVVYKYQLMLEKIGLR